MRLRNLNEDKNEKPFRNRVEVFATKDGKVYGGFYPDGSFGAFGGGTDGESIEDSAKREFEEESGYKLKNVKKLDIDPVEVLWGEPKSKKQKDRMEEYKGTRTWFLTGVLDDSGDKNKSDGDDGKHNLKDVGLIDINDAIDSIKKNFNDDESIKKQQHLRIKALGLIKNNL